MLAILPALFLPLILFLPKTHSRGKEERQENKKLLPHRVAGQNTQRSTIFYWSQPPCCGHNKTEGVSVQFVFSSQEPTETV